ncbi:hypothetical protein BD410DRAFT_795460 [Rickenella mellea]|uniref:Uncharacterized protein n=1 Tax=Rickenella mellea TaxID=50990 RepID=A0A4Y7PP29_9AGAM|nr:hypothetical protein BD410DRAFT_795460 [Rickenella mellea]
MHSPTIATSSKTHSFAPSPSACPSPSYLSQQPRTILWEHSPSYPRTAFIYTSRHARPVHPPLIPDRDNEPERRLKLNPLTLKRHATAPSPFPSSPCPTPSIAFAWAAVYSPPPISCPGKQSQDPPSRVKFPLTPTSPITSASVRTSKSPVRLASSTSPPHPPRSPLPPASSSTVAPKLPPPPPTPSLAAVLSAQHYTCRRLHTTTGNGNNALPIAIRRKTTIPVASHARTAAGPSATDAVIADLSQNSGDGSDRVDAAEVHNGDGMNLRVGVELKEHCNGGAASLPTPPHTPEICVPPSLAPASISCEFLDPQSDPCSLQRSSADDYIPAGPISELTSNPLCLVDLRDDLSAAASSNPPNPSKFADGVMDASHPTHPLSPSSSSQSLLSLPSDERYVPLPRGTFCSNTSPHPPTKTSSRTHHSHKPKPSHLISKSTEKISGAMVASDADATDVSEAEGEPIPIAELDVFGAGLVIALTDWTAGGGSWKRSRRAPAPRSSRERRVRKAAEVPA